MIQTSSALRKIISRSLTLLALISALLLPAYASDDLSLSDARTPTGEYTHLVNLVNVYISEIRNNSGMFRFQRNKAQVHLVFFAFWFILAG